MTYFKGTIDRRGNFTPYKAKVLVMPAPGARGKLLHHGPVEILKFRPAGVSVRHREWKTGTLLPKQV